MTIPPLTEQWQTRKPAVSGSRGVVASQHVLASRIGARVLADRGNAVDAAVAAGLAIGTMEPGMSGIGGGGYMQVAPAGEDTVHTVHFGMVAPQGLDPADYPIVGGRSGDLFSWPAVKDDRNIMGYHSMAVPGYVAGVALALERFGTVSWVQALEPAITLAEAGMEVDWYANLRIANNARDLARFDSSRAVFLPDGLPPGHENVGPLPRLRLGNLAATLKRLAQAGPRDFYEGRIARDIARDVAHGGGSVVEADLKAYRASVHEAVRGRYRDATIHGASGLTAGPTLVDALSRLASRSDGGGDDAEYYTAIAASLFEAYENRLATLGDPGGAAEDTCTTHITVVDGEGTVVALTQTLLSIFGSRVMLPGTGILMNNGVMWFDPEPGKPNSLGPGKRPLSNMCPTVVVRGDGCRIALGASGGRRIMPAILQLVSFLIDRRLSLEDAFHTPRIDVSGGDELLYDPRLNSNAIEALKSRFSAVPQEAGVIPTAYACPNAVRWDPVTGRTEGAAFVMSPLAAAVAVPNG